MLAERAQRLEADKKAKEAAAKKEAEARAKARKDAGDTNAPPSSSTTTNANIDPAERKYAEELRHRKQQATEERRRILKRIEDDRRERKEREAQERQARLLAQTQAQDGGSGGRNIAATSTPPLSSARTSATAADGQRHQTCHLQVRLLTGTSIRARFPATATLATDVRPWVDASATAADPSGEAHNAGAYSFKVVLTPRPNRAVARAEESALSLADLELPPSATLVVVPSSASGGVAEAYARSGNPVSRALGYLLRFLAALWAFFASLLMLGGGGGGGRRGGPEDAGQADLAASADDASAASGKATGSSRIRGFNDDGAEQRRRRDAQLYNGNSVSSLRFIPTPAPFPSLLPFCPVYTIGRPQSFANMTRCS